MLLNKNNGSWHMPQCSALSTSNIMIRILVFWGLTQLLGCTNVTTKTSSPGVQLDTRNLEAPRTLSEFSKDNQQCYDRATRPYTFVVDGHNHFRPFGGNAIPLYELSEYFHRLGVLFVNAYGIGQTLPIDSGCEYYLDCEGIKVIPSIHNDFRNASNYLEYTPEGINITLSMSFPNLAEPQYVLPQIKLLDKEYPEQFHWMGEVNLVKQALFGNGHKPTPIEKIAEWNEFMELLRQREIPIAIHSDLGSNEAPTKYLNLIEEVLRLYPDNHIVWMHMGLSLELDEMDPQMHIEILERLLNQYPKLMLDISWRIIYDHYFSKHAIREQYVRFLNQYSSRILPGTDFVASRRKDFLVYAQEVEVNSRINLYLDDEAFRNIALGQNYFRLMKLAYQAPQICENDT